MLLPLDIIIYIFSFEPCMKYRNGKFMNQIPRHSEIYEKLLHAPRKHRYFTDKPIHYWNSCVEMFSNHGLVKYTMEYNNYKSVFDASGVCLDNKVSFYYHKKNLLDDRIYYW